MPVYRPPLISVPVCPCLLRLAPTELPCPPQGQEDEPTLLLAAEAGPSYSMPTVRLYPRRAAVDVQCLLLEGAAALSCSTPTALEWADSDLRVHWAQMLSPTGLLSLAFRQRGDRGEAVARFLALGRSWSVLLGDRVTRLEALSGVLSGLSWMV